MLEEAHADILNMQAGMGDDMWKSCILQVLMNEFEDNHFASAVNRETVPSLAGPER